MSRSNPTDNYEREVWKDNPVAYWRLNDSGATAVDETGVYPGTYVGSPASGQGAIVGNGAKVFDTGKYISVNDADEFTPTAALTVELWAKASSTAAQSVLISKYDSGANQRSWSLGTDATNKKRLVVTLSSTAATFTGVQVVTNSDVLVDGQWVHIAFVFYSGTLAIYASGASISYSTITGTSIPLSLANNTSPTFIGSGILSGAATPPFVGSIDEVAVYNTALSPTRIAAHYAARLNPPGPTFRVRYIDPLTLSPALWLRDDGSTAGVWEDRSGNGRNATGATPPTIVTGALNGRQVRRFNGSNQYLATSAFSVPQPSTVFVVSQHTSAVDGQIIDGLVSGNRNSIAYNSSNLFAYTAGGSSPQFTGATVNTFSIIAVEFNTASSFWLNGTFKRSDSIGTASINGYNIGRAYNGFSLLTRDIAEILVFPRALSSYESQLIESYLSERWGIPLT